MRNIHIGVVIESKMRERHLSNADFARRLGMSKQNVGALLKRRSIQCQLLEKISDALLYDFFQHYSTSLEDLRRENMELKSKNEILTKENEEAKREMEFYERTVRLLTPNK